MPNSTRPFISIIICTRNRPTDIALCLPTVLACRYPNYEVILVDQSTNDQTAEQVRGMLADHPNLHYFPTTTVGKTNALNIALDKAQGEILAFTDDDCEIPEEWLEAIEGHFHADEKVDVIFGQVFPSPALKDIENICVPSWMFTEERLLRKDDTCGMGANMAMRRRALACLPEGAAFDGLLGPGVKFPAGEEGDFSYRLRCGGATAALRPSLFLYHRAYRTPADWEKIMYGYGVGDAAFLTKHVRCGDYRALSILARKLCFSSLRSGIKLLIRRSTSEPYVKGLWQGIRESRRLAIDCKTRLYVLPEAAH